MTNAKIKKPTMATVKSFIKKNFEALEINVKSKFDGMTDGCESVNDGFSKAQATTDHLDYTKGVKGAWFVGGSRDYVTAYDEDGRTGFTISNSCGHFVLAVKK